MIHPYTKQEVIEVWAEYHSNLREEALYVNFDLEKKKIFNPKAMPQNPYEISSEIIIDMVTERSKRFKKIQRALLEFKKMQGILRKLENAT